MPDISRN